MKRACCLLLAPLLSAQPQPARGVNSFSLEKEIALGRAMAQEHRRQNPAVDSPALHEYLLRIVDRLNQFAHSPFPVSLELTASSGGSAEIVPFPGGFIVVPLSVVLTVNSEEELAGRLAHALAHITARHATRAATRAQLAGLATIPLVFTTMHATDRQVIPLSFVAYQRKLEIQADELAVQWVREAGYVGQDSPPEFAAMKELALQLTSQPKPRPPTLLR